MYGTFVVSILTAPIDVITGNDIPVPADTDVTPPPPPPDELGISE
jgi:hypothetical protein